MNAAMMSVVVLRAAGGRGSARGAGVDGNACSSGRGVVSSRSCGVCCGCGAGVAAGFGFGAQVLCPLAGCVSPSGQAWHVLCPGCAAKLPAAHGRHACQPACTRAQGSGLTAGGGVNRSALAPGIDGEAFSSPFVRTNETAEACRAASRRDISLLSRGPGGTSRYLSFVAGAGRAGARMRTSPRRRRSSWLRRGTPWPCLSSERGVTGLLERPIDLRCWRTTGAGPRTRTGRWAVFEQGLRTKTCIALGARGRARLRRKAPGRAWHARRGAAETLRRPLGARAALEREDARRGQRHVLAAREFALVAGEAERGPAGSGRAPRHPHTQFTRSHARARSLSQSLSLTLPFFLSPSLSLSLSLSLTHAHTHEQDTCLQGHTLSRRALAREPLSRSFPPSHPGPGSRADGRALRGCDERHCHVVHRGPHPMNDMASTGWSDHAGVR
jgi:hypothetical protein